jgi:predicted amidophosphoribosyltransferase
MSLDDRMEVAPTEGLSSTSFLRWCVLDISGHALICAACDVSWLRETADCCWVCGAEGQRVRDLKRS